MPSFIPVNIHFAWRCGDCRQLTHLPSGMGVVPVDTRQPLTLNTGALVYGVKSAQPFSTLILKKCDI